MSELNQRIGKHLRMLRKESGLTQSELAKKIGSNQQHVSELERGILNPTTDYLKKVADALNVSFRINIDNTPL